MHSARAAEWILSQVLPPDRAVSTVGDWLEDATDRGRLWFWSCVFRTVLSRIWSDFAESPGFLVGLALRGWLYQLWLIAGASLLGICVLIPAVLVAGNLGKQLHWHPSWPFHTSWIAQVWTGWIGFKTARWIAQRAPGRELAAGIATCLTPWVISFPPWLLAMHFWGPEINRYLASHPVTSDSLPTILPTEIFLLAGILWSRHKSPPSVTQ